MKQAEARADFRCKEKTYDDYWMGRVTVQELTFSIPGIPPFTLTVSQHMLSQEEHTKELTKLGEWMVAALTSPPGAALAAENQRLKQAINQMAYRMDSRAAERTRVGATEEAVIYRRCADIVSEEHARAALNAELPGGQK